MAILATAKEATGQSTALTGKFVPTRMWLVLADLHPHTLRAQPSCNTGGNWFINKNMMTAAYDYEFSVDINNLDNDDSGVVFRFKDKNNFIRLHHTLENQYNKNTKGGIANGGCTGTGSFLVVRKNGKEYCAKKTSWKYTQNKFHTFKVTTTISGGVQIWVDGKLHINVNVRLSACSVQRSRLGYKP